jgi:hypothetical protein
VRRVGLELERLLPSVPLRGGDMVPRRHRLNRFCLVRARVPAADPEAECCLVVLRGRVVVLVRDHHALRRRQVRQRVPAAVRDADRRPVVLRAGGVADLGRGPGVRQRHALLPDGCFPHAARSTKASRSLASVSWMTPRAPRAGSLACASASYLMVPTRRSSCRRVLTANIKFCTPLKPKSRRTFLTAATTWSPGKWRAKRQSGRHRRRWYLQTPHGRDDEALLDAAARTAGSGKGVAKELAPEDGAASGDKGRARFLLLLLGADDVDEASSLPVSTYRRCYFSLFT